MPRQAILYPQKAEPVLDAGQRPETILVSEWWRPASEPRRFPPRSHAALVASGGVLQLGPGQQPEVIRPDEWWRQASEPARFPRPLVREGFFAREMTGNPVAVEAIKIGRAHV